MKRLGLSLAVCASVAMGATNEELAKELAVLKEQMQQMQQSQQSLIDEVANATYLDGNEYEGFSSMGGAASKVYYSKDALSIGGYGEYKATKYMDYKNYDSAAANDTRNKLETNIVRFVPYIGFKFNDWILMNTEIEFEDGGARSDGEKNYKYAIVEFSYLDFLIDTSFAIRIGHLLTPMGLTNLNHEPVAFLTTERPSVETFIIPSTWHVNGVLAHGSVDELEYYAGFVNSPDAGGFTEGRFIQQGRPGARVFSDDFSFVTRLSYDLLEGMQIGGSFLYGNTSVASESKPGTSSGVTTDAKIFITMAEAHMTYKNEGWHLQALASYGRFDGDLSELRTATAQEISQSVNGQYLCVGYDIMPLLSKANQNLFIFAEVERLDMDAGADTTYVDNNRFMEYTAGMSYFPDPKVTLKADYKRKDYGEAAKLADENVLAFVIGFIF